MRILVECTCTYENPTLNTGIQRVVRALTGALPGLGVNGGVEFIPVIFRGGRVYRVLRLSSCVEQAGAPFFGKVLIFLEFLANRFWWWYSRVERLRVFSDIHSLRWMLWHGAKVFDNFIFLVMTIVRRVFKGGDLYLRAIPFDVVGSDRLLLLDSSWHKNFSFLVSALKRKGVEIAAVIYDLIPLTHPGFCHYKHVRNFERWFDWVVRSVDGFISISRSVSLQLQGELASRLGDDQARTKWNDYFYLGADIEGFADAGAESADVKSIFEGKSVYLAVGTLEPRKNHAVLLDAFEGIWASGIDHTLCIVGKVGWECDHILQRIKSHGEFGRRLVMLNSASDADLVYMYRACRALIFPSCVEGFGLPLVEALQSGVPVIANDIPIFREVGGDFIKYFDAGQASDLVVAIQEFEGEQELWRGKVSDWRWLKWSDSAAQLVERVVRGFNKS